MSERADRADIDGTNLEEVYFDDLLDEDDLEPLQTLAFDPEPGREKVRAMVAGALIALLALLSCGALGAVIAGVSGEEVRAITELVLPPVVALCGSAIGFYYATGRENP